MNKGWEIIVTLSEEPREFIHNDVSCLKAFNWMEYRWLLGRKENRAEKNRQLYRSSYYLWRKLYKAEHWNDFLHIWKNDKYLIHSGGWPSLRLDNLWFPPISSGEMVVLTKMKTFDNSWIVELLSLRLMQFPFCFTEMSKQRNLSACLLLGGNSPKWLRMKSVSLGPV